MDQDLPVMSGQDWLNVKVEVTLTPGALAGLTSELSNLASLPGVRSVNLAIPATTVTISNSVQPSDSKPEVDGDSGPAVLKGLVCGECRNINYHTNNCSHGYGRVTPEQV